MDSLRLIPVSSGVFWRESAEAGRRYSVVLVCGCVYYGNRSIALSINVCFRYVI